MFGDIFNVLKRWLDNSAVPLTLGVGVAVLEKAMGLITWVLVFVGDFFVGLFGWALSLVPPLPDFHIDETVFGAKFLDVCQVAGVWPASGVYVGIAIVALLCRIFTINIVGNQ